jgi:hypothetical protein
MLSFLEMANEQTAEEIEQMEPISLIHNFVTPNKYRHKVRVIKKLNIGGVLKTSLLARHIS